MKSEQIYQNLKELAEKLDITILEQNLRKADIKVKSGFCKIKGKKFVIIDKNLTVHKKNKILATCLNQMSHEEIYVLPAVREFLCKHI